MTWQVRDPSVDGGVTVELSGSSDRRTWVVASRPWTKRRAPQRWSYTGEAFEDGRVWSCGHVHELPLLAHACVLEWMGLMGLDRRPARGQTFRRDDRMSAQVVERLSTRPASELIA